MVKTMVLWGLCAVGIASMPALPKEARTLGSGVMSFFVAMAIAVAVYVLAAQWLATTAAAKNTPILASSIAVLFVYLMALIDKGSVIVALLMAVWILNEVITPAKLVGAALIAAGLLVISRG